MRIGLFGGTFNPIHNGHLSIASEVLEKLALDKVIFIPAGDPPHKKNEDLVPAVHRLEMVRLAVAPYDQFEVSSVEMERSGPSYSVDTVRGFRKTLGEGPELFFLVGIDAFREVMTWKDPRTLFSLCHFVVISRPGCRFGDLRALPCCGEAPPDSLELLDRGERDSLEIPLSETTRLILRKVTPSPVSATDLRERISRREGLKNLLPPPVELYILAKNLYQPAVLRGF